MRRQIILFLCFLSLFSIVRYSLRVKKSHVSISEKTATTDKNETAKACQLLDEGQRLLNEGKYQKALEKYKAACEIETDNAQAHHGMGISYYRLGKFDQAVTSFKRATGLNPNQWRYWYDLGFTYRTTGRAKEALNAYKKALDINPESELITLSLGDVHLFLLKDFEMAERRYKEGLVLNPQNANVYNNLGHICERKGRGNEAKGYYKQALKIDPFNKNARRNLNRLVLIAYKAEVEAIEQPKSLELFKSALQALPEGKMAEREFITLLEERVIPECKQFTARFSRIKPDEPKLAAIHQKGVEAVNLKYDALVGLLQGTIDRDEQSIQRSEALIDQAQAREAEFLEELKAYSDALQ